MNGAEAITHYNVLLVNYTSMIHERGSTIDSLNFQIADLRGQLDALNTSYSWPRAHSSKYCMAGGAINVSGVGICERKFSPLLVKYIVNRTITSVVGRSVKRRTSTR